MGDLEPQAGANPAGERGMTLEEACARQLEKDEGRRSAVYKDHLGYWTIGVGFLVDARRGGGLLPEEIDFILGNRIRVKRNELETRLPWFQHLSEPRQAGLINMAFQLGTEGLLRFKESLAAMRDNHFDHAENLLLDSDWARQTPDRAKRVARQIASGEWQG
jgi:lysozyme